MRKIRKDKKSRLPKVLFGSGVFACLGLGVIFVMSIPLIESIKQRNQVENEIQGIKNEISSLKTENQDLENLIEYLNSDRFLEEQARLNFGLKKRGENVVVITDKGKVAGVSTTSQIATSNNKTGMETSNPKKWFSYFFEEE